MKNIFSLFGGILLILISSAGYSGELKYSNDPSQDPSIGYKSVDEALVALKGKEGVEVRIQQGWIIAQDASEGSVWSFAPEEHPAHPAAVKRTVFEEDGSVHIKTGILCQSRKAECDKLAEQFQELNDRVRQEMQGK